MWKTSGSANHRFSLSLAVFWLICVGIPLIFIYCSLIVIVCSLIFHWALLVHVCWCRSECHHAAVMAPRQKAECLHSRVMALRQRAECHHAGVMALREKADAGVLNTAQYWAQRGQDLLKLRSFLHCPWFLRVFFLPPAGFFFGNILEYVLFCFQRVSLISLWSCYEKSAQICSCKFCSCLLGFVHVPLMILLTNQIHWFWLNFMFLVLWPKSFKLCWFPLIFLWLSLFSFDFLWFSSGMYWLSCISLVSGSLTLWLSFFLCIHMHAV